MIGPTLAKMLLPQLRRVKSRGILSAMGTYRQPHVKWRAGDVDSASGQPYTLTHGSGRFIGACVPSIPPLIGSSCFTFFH